MLEIEKTYKICRRVHQSLFVNATDTFIEYIQSLDLDEIQQMDEDIKSNGWGVKSLLEIDNIYDLLRIFQMFYHFNGRLPLTNGLLILPDGETFEGAEKISLKDLYEMLQGTKSLGLVSLQFLCALDIFFGGDALTELHHNLSYETLSGGRNFNFEAISDLVADMSFQIKKLTLSNLKRKRYQDKKSANDIKNSHEFFDEGDDEQKIEDELKEDFFKKLDLIKQKMTMSNRQFKMQKQYKEKQKKNTMNF